jgi:hypothetical protein
MHEQLVHPPSETQVYDVGAPAGPPVIEEQYWRPEHVSVPQGNFLPL